MSTKQFYEVSLDKRTLYWCDLIKNWLLNFEHRDKISETDYAHLQFFK